jgi:hypothetical protein
MKNEMKNEMKIIRFYFKSTRQMVVKRGLTLKEARAHCSNPESDSTTCTSETAQRRTGANGPWFDGFRREA